MRICFVASEVAPLAKTGGLADVAGVLPRHLHDQGHDIRVVMPLYSSIGTAALEMMPVEGAQHVELRLGAHLYHYSLYETRLPGSAVPLYLVHCPAVYDRATIYTSGPTSTCASCVLQRAALDMLPAPGVRAGHRSLQRLAHGTAADAAQDGVRVGPTCFARRAPCSRSTTSAIRACSGAVTSRRRLGDVAHLLAPEISAGGRFNFLRDGIVHADAVTTVSPTYAREIRHRSTAYGLDGVLRARGDGRRRHPQRRRLRRVEPRDRPH